MPGLKAPHAPSVTDPSGSTGWRQNKQVAKQCPALSKGMVRGCSQHWPSVQRRGELLILLHPTALTSSGHLRV